MRADRCGWIIGLVAVGVTLWATSCARAGILDALRDDVRGVASDETEASANDTTGESEKRRRNVDWDYDDEDSDITFDAMVGLAVLTGATVTSPFWGPPYCLSDDYSVAGYFPSFPYANGNRGYLMINEGTGRPRRWAARVRSEYSDAFDDMSRIGGQLLVSTTSRWGLDTEMNYLQERFDGGRYDHLWLGDCNVVYRFAQSERMEWRTGIGFNWLDDPIDTDFGFNFTYGFDIYPIRPLVLSTELDWGTLGSAEAFHFRTTAGAVIHGLEAYFGYEYRDIDRFHFNGLIAGVRLWF
jgi:hypothetical protein